MPRKPTYDELEKRVKELEKKTQERKRSEVGLRNSQQFNETVISSVSEGVVVYDSEFRFLLWNKFMENMIGVPAEKLLGKYIFDVFPHLKEEGIDESLERALAGETIHTPDTYFEFPSGKKRWILSSYTPHLDPNGNIIGVVANVLDTTERKQAEEALRESEENYRSLVDSTEDSIYLVDRDCRYLFMNEKHLSRFGLLTDKVIGRAYSEFHSEEETEGFEEKVKEVFETGTSLSYEYRSQRDGRYFIRTLSPVKEPDGRTTAVTVVSKNITERKRAEEALRQAAALKTLTTVLENFIGDSLGNLLFIVYGQLGLCKLSNSIDQVRSNIRAATQGLTELIQGTQAYQEFSSLREGSLGDINSVALGPILEPLLSGEPLQTYQKKRFEINPQVRLRFVYDPKQQEALSWEELPSVSGSSLAIRTALQETLINAVESYDPKKGGDVVVSAKKEGYNLILEIADKGRGMSNEEREKSQLPFFKILSIKGSARLGLGAYIARQSAKYCEGDIHIESREALGTTASIILKISDKVS